MADWDDEEVSVAMPNNEAFNAAGGGVGDNYDNADEEDWGPTAAMVNSNQNVGAKNDNWGGRGGGDFNRRSGGGDGGGYNRQRNGENDDVNTLLLQNNNQTRNTLIPDIPDTYDESIMEEFLSKLNFSDYYTSPCAMNRLIVYLISALDFHVKKEQNLMKHKMKPSTTTTTIQMPRSEEINELLKTTANDDDEESNALNLLEDLRSSYIDSNLCGVGGGINNSLLLDNIQEDISSVDGAGGGGGGGVGSIGLPISQRIIDTLERMPELPELSIEAANLLIPDLPDDLFTANLSNIQTTTTKSSTALLQQPRMITSTRKRKEPAEGASKSAEEEAAAFNSMKLLEEIASAVAATNVRRDQTIRNRHYNERLIRLAEPIKMRKIEDIKPLPKLPENMNFIYDKSAIISYVMSHGLWAWAANTENMLPDTSFAFKAEHVAVSTSSSSITTSSSSENQQQQQQKQRRVARSNIEQLHQLQEEEQNIPQQLRDVAVTAATAATSVASSIKNDITPRTAFSDFLSSINEVNMPAANSADLIAAPPIVAMSHSSGDSQNTATDMSNTLVPFLVTAIGSDGGGASGGPASADASNSVPVVDISSLGGGGSAASLSTTTPTAVLTPLNARNASLVAAAGIVGGGSGSGIRSVIPVSFLQRHNLTSILEVDAEYRRTFENQRGTISSTPLVVTQQSIGLALGGRDDDDNSVNPRRILSSTEDRTVVNEQNNGTDPPTLSIPETNSMAAQDNIVVIPGTKIPISAQELSNDGEQSQLQLMEVVGNGQNILPPLENDDYRRDWFNILRKRHLMENVSYVDESGVGSPTKRPRRRRRHRAQPLEGQQQQQQDNATLLAAPLNEAEQMLAAIIPPPPPPPPPEAEVAAQPLLEQQQQKTNMIEAAHLPLDEQQQLELTQMPMIDEQPIPQPPPPVEPDNTLSDEMMIMSTSYQQQKHDEFILQNQEEISTIMDMDNLPLVRMLVEHNHALIEEEDKNQKKKQQQQQQQQTHEQSQTGDRREPKCYPTLPATYTYDPDLILKEDPTKLRIKIALLNAVISQREVDLKRTDFIRNRYEGAIAFGFLLELKAMKVITLSREGDRRGGGGGGYNRERNDGGGRRRADDDGGYNRERNDGGGRRRADDDGEFNINKGGGEIEDGTEKKREFYIPPEPTNDETEVFNTGITSGINFSKYENIAVNVSGENVPPPIKKFSETDLREIILDNVKKSGYKVPTPIQKVAIPVISAGRDLMACAQTGSGKTAAFLLPILSGILSEGKELEIGKPHAIVVAPTRELAVQTYNEARKFAYTSYIKINIVYGGTSFKYQNENVSKGCHLLICTPGRLLDFVNRAFITFEDTRYVVLDEADRMLDMGFLESIKTIMTHQTMCNEHQTLMFSATFPEEIQRLAGEFLTDYVFVAIGVVGGACSDVKQQILEVNKFNKRAKLLEILREGADGTIVFVETKRGADFLASFFSETEFPTTSIHGDRLQSQRETALRDFKAGTMKVLIATSVASRGLDIKNVNHVINFDMPQSIDDYVHRIGRTGRVGNNGRATSFFDPEYDRAIAEDLVKILEDAEQEVPEFLREIGGGYGGGESSGNGHFGGFDVRGKQNNAGAALEENLDWDV